MMAYRQMTHMGVSTEAKIMLGTLYRLFSKAPQKCFSVPEQFASSDIMFKDAVNLLLMGVNLD